MLNGIEGRKSGSIEGYKYSDANKNPGLVWNEATFLEYIRDPCTSF
jgi:cytochrome c